MNLHVNFMGWELENPLIVAAGIWSRDGEHIRRCLDAGAAAVVTKSIVNQVSRDIQPRIACRGDQVQNLCLYNDISLEQWAEEIQVAKAAGGKVIASILAYSPSEMSYIAAKLEKFGADALELGLSTLMWDGAEVFMFHPDKLQQMIQSVVETVQIPVMLKISPNISNLPQMVRTAEKSGVAAICAIESLRSILGVDLEKQRPYLPTYGGYSGPAIRPLGLASVATIAQNVSTAQICGVGGIENYENVLEYMMLGAHAVQVGTAMMMQGPEVIPRILRGLEGWMQEHGVEDLASIRGKALEHLYPFEEIKVIPKVARCARSCDDPACRVCSTVCMYDAVKKEGQAVTIDRSRCDGCGCCVSACPHGYLELGLR